MNIGIGKKHPVYTDECVEWLMMLSKSALVDCVVDLMRQMQTSADDNVGADHAIKLLTPVLNMRGDKVPVTPKQRMAKLGQRLETRRLIREAMERKQS